MSANAAAPMSAGGTTVYRALALLAARQLVQLPAVRGVSARRSLACGEVAFWRSDVDLTILIAPAADLEGEAAALERLAARFAALRRALRVLGTCEIGTRTELETWYRSPWFPASAFRDRGWLHLTGERFTPPASPLGAAERQTLLRWLLWAWETLPRFYRRGNTRTCANIFLDMVNVHELYTGRLDRPATRADLLERWRPLAGGKLRPDDLRRALRGVAHGRAAELRRAIYRESLALCDAVFAAVPERIEGRLAARELRPRVPFELGTRRYLLVDPTADAEVDRALDVMERDATAHATSERTLRLYWYHRNPWEYFARGAEGARRDVAPPPRPAILAAIRYYLHRVVPRRFGLSVGRRSDRSATLGLRYAQSRLWLGHGLVADGPETLAEAYRAAYGAWPYTTAPTRTIYFRERYPLLCREIEALAALAG